MKRNNKILLLLITVAVVLTALLLAACGEVETPQGSSTSSSSTTSSTQGGSSSGGDKDTGKTSYTISVKDGNTGKALSGVTVYIVDEKSEEAILYANGKTDANGFVTLKAKPENAKFVTLDNLPYGYVGEDYYDLGATGKEIKVYTKIVENEDNDFSGVSISLGDVMTDFTLHTYNYNKETQEIETKEITLSDLFKNGKKAVMLNFWYTTCTYCIEEFPYIQAAYEKYGSQIEIIGINAYAADSEKDVLTFLKQFATTNNYVSGGCALTFPMAMDTYGIQDAFGFTVNPCSVIIDRYGVVSLVQVGGVMGERYFTNAMEHYVKGEYEQKLYSTIYELSPLAEPDVEMSPVDEMKDAFVNGDVNVNFRPETEGEDAKYAWPFVVVDKDGKKCIATTNMDLDGSYCILYVDVELKAGQGIIFDYYASTQRLYDVLYVLVDGKDIYSISGRPTEDDKGNLLEDPWKSCCPWVATEDGTYELAFCYIKDENGMEGEDRVYLDNLRVVSEAEIGIETYIPRYAATGKQDDNSFANYVEIVFNAKDGYYHVGKEDGPILLASLLGSNSPFTLKFSEDKRFTVTTKLTEIGEFIIDGKDMYNKMMMYCNYASNSKLYGYCPVTKELMGYLVEFTKQYNANSRYEDNTWLQLCSYYDSYGTDAELTDPIKGLATFSAYEAVVTPEGDSEGFLNTVTYSQVIMPRGLLFKFIPTKSGVYRITSKSTQEVDGWVFVGDIEKWLKENGGDRILYIDSSTGERYCPELLIDKDGKGTYVRDYTNCSMIGYFEEGVEYYIDIAYYDVYATGTFTFDLKYVADSFNVFEEASQGPFSYDEISMEIYATGIKVELCKDENDPRYGYYCQLLPNGELGSIVYADFHYITNVFPTMSIQTLIEQNAFNMFMTETDKEAYVYRMEYYEKGGVKALKDLWGEEFDAKWEIYQMDDIIQNPPKFHGKGPDYTEQMREYLSKLETGKDENGEYTSVERQGCVAVDAKLAVMLQALMDKFTFEGVENSWTKLCYYYKTLEAPKSVSEMREELTQIVESADVKNAEIDAEISNIITALDAAIANSTIVSVQRGLIEDAFYKIVELIKLAEQAE